MTASPDSCTAFAGQKQIASGSVRFVAVKAREALDEDPAAQILIFDDLTSELVEVDLRGTISDVERRLEARSAAPEPAPGARKAGRPKLGVVAREVTLLPRHWDWLAGRSGGASVALRKLIEREMKQSEGRDLLRRAQEGTYRFLSAMAGNEPHFEDAIRALFAADATAFHAAIAGWPLDIRAHAGKISSAAFPAETHRS